MQTAITYESNRRSPVELFQESVQDRTAELMAGSYSPLRADNFEEAIGESMVDPLGSMPQTIIALLGTENGPYVIARLLLAVSTEYMAYCAALKAETLVLEVVPA